MEQLKETLFRLGDRIDLVIISHGHPDHFENRAVLASSASNFDRFSAAGTFFIG